MAFSFGIAPLGVEHGDKFHAVVLEGGLHGGQLLASAVSIFFSTAGNGLLAAIIILACLTTSCGMLSGGAWFFNQLFKKRISYERLLLFFTFFSFAVSNVGLTQIMSIVGIILTSPEIAGNFTSPAALKISEKLTIIPKSEKFDLLKILAKELESRPTSAFVEMEVSRSGKLRGTTMSRLAAVRFPFYRELKKDVEKTRKESTMNLSLEEVKFLIELHEAIVPGIDDPEAYNVGVGMWIAPFFTVMVKGAVGLLATLAESKQAFPGMFDDACVVDDDYSWVSVLDNKEALDRFNAQFE